MKLLKHLRNWLEAYFWLPLSLAGVIGAAAIYNHIVGAPVSENPIWLVGYAEKLVQLFLLLVVATVIKQQTGGAWLTKDEKLRLMFVNRPYSVAETLKTPFYFAVACYVLLH